LFEFLIYLLNAQTNLSLKEAKIKAKVLAGYYFHAYIIMFIKNKTRCQIL